MAQILNRIIWRLIPPLIILLSAQERITLGLAPQGCDIYSNTATCSFQQWIPPLRDEEFGPQPWYILRVHDINGTIPPGAFDGLNGPPTNSSTYIYLNCNNGKTILSRDIFTQNLHWVMHLWISNCYLENGLPSRLLENLKSLKSLSIRGGEIDWLVADDALAGLTNLLLIHISSPVKQGNLPSGFFDGLTNLTFINLGTAELNFIPPNWFNGLVNLEFVHLFSNNLQTLPPGLFDELRSLTYVSLNNNPWNCSCELMWLLAWSSTTDGVLCQAPQVVEHVKLEDALSLLTCTPSNSPVLSTLLSYTTEATDRQATSIATIAVSPTLHQAGTTLTSTLGLKTISSSEDGITSASTLRITKAFKTLATSVASSMTSKTATVTPSTARPIRTATRTSSTAHDIGTTTTLFTFSSFPSTKSAFSQAFSQALYSTSKCRSANGGGFVNGIHYIVVSAFGTLTVSLVVAAFL